MFEVREKPQMVERALLVRICFDKREEEDAASLLAELEELVTTLGIGIAESVLVRSRGQHKRFICGTGKAEELADRARDMGCDCIVFDNEVSPMQQRAWEETADMTVLDREEVGRRGLFRYGSVADLHSGEVFDLEQDPVVAHARQVSNLEPGLGVEALGAGVDVQAAKLEATRIRRMSQSCEPPMNTKKMSSGSTGTLATTSAARSPASHTIRGSATSTRRNPARR